MDSNDKELDEAVGRIKARLAASASRGNINGVDPDNPYEIQRHERTSQEFFTERMNLEVKILYVHGFASSGHSGTARTLQKYLPKSKVFSPDLPIDPSEALNLLRDIVSREKIDVVVGTSMGGMLAQKLRGVPKVLVNPSFHVSESMRRKTGIVPFYSSREDGATEFEVTKELCDAYKNLENNQFENLDESEKANTIGLFGTNDDVVNNQQEYDRYYPKKMIFVGGHRLTEDVIHDFVVESILKLLHEK